MKEMGPKDFLMGTVASLFVEGEHRFGNKKGKQQVVRGRHCIPLGVSPCLEQDSPGLKGGLVDKALPTMTNKDGTSPSTSFL